MVIETVMLLGCSAFAVPNRGQVANVSDGSRTRIYTGQISASLQFGRGLDSPVFSLPVAF